MARRKNDKADSKLSPINQENEQNKLAERIQQTVVKRSHNVFVGSWLILVYCVTVIFSISVLGSYQIQSRVRAVELDTATISIWRLDEMSKFLTKLQSDQTNIEKALEAEKNTLTEQVQKRIKLDREYDVLFAEYTRQIEEFETELQTENPTYIFEHGNNKPTVTVRKLFGYFKGDLENLVLTQEHQKTLSKLQIDVNSYINHYAKLSQAKIDIEKTEGEITALNEKLEDAKTKTFQGLEGMRGLTASEAKSPLLQNTVLEFHELKPMFWGVFYKLAIIPSELLVLFLVLAMGALGSTIFITQLFFNAKQNEFGLLFYLSRPFFGATIALSIFVLAKAGVLFLTDTQSGNAKPSLSPFFISFIAIISGLMSEQAILTIRRAGNRWLDNQNEGIARWGVNLGSTIETKGKHPQDFTNTIDITMETMTAWINQKVAVPYTMQERLSAWLETKPRELFTDLPPDDQDEESQASKMKRKLDTA